MAVGPEPGWYTLVYILTIAAVEGWVKPSFHRWSVPSQVRKLLGIALLVPLMTWLAFIVFTPSGLAYGQGRYLFPVMVPVTFFLVGGWVRWTPERWQRHFAPTILILLATLDAAAFCLALWPFFYGR